jgi:hypothetical protein
MTQRDPRVSVIVSSSSAPKSSPQGQATIKGTVKFHDGNEVVRQWHYRMLSKKMHPGDKTSQEALIKKVTNPIRTVLEVTPVKWITFDMTKVQAFEAGTDGGAYKEHLLSADTERLQAEVALRGLTFDDN